MPSTQTVMKELILQVEQDKATGLLVASWNDPAGGDLTTQGTDLGEMEANIRAAAICHFEDGKVPPSIRLHLVSDLVLSTA